MTPIRPESGQTLIQLDCTPTEAIILSGLVEGIQIGVHLYPVRFVDLLWDATAPSPAATRCLEDAYARGNPELYDHNPDAEDWPPVSFEEMEKTPCT